MIDLLQYLSNKIKDSNGKQASQYRQDMAKALIDSYPPNTKITYGEFHVALNFSPKSSSVYTFMDNLIKNKEIERVGTSPYCYKVLIPGNTYEKERAEVDPEPRKFPADEDLPMAQPDKFAELPGSEPSPILTQEPEITEKAYTLKELEAEAIRFQFYFPEFTDIRHFLYNLKNLEDKK